MESHSVFMLEDNIVKVAVLLKLIYRFSAIPIKITAAFFAEVDKVHPKIQVEVQQTQSSKTNLKKSKVGELTF